MIAPERLYLAYLPETPPLAEYDIKKQRRRPFLGTEFTFTVIGDSHYIGAPELGFHELLSCKPVQQGRVKTVPLEATRRPADRPAGSVDGREIHTGRYQFGSVDLTTTIKCEPLSAFPGPETFDIAYRFGPKAYTTINCPSTDSYETYHTYPEYGLALYTKNEFTESPNSQQTAPTWNQNTKDRSLNWNNTEK